MKNADDFGKLILRLTVGGLLLFHGVAKLGHGIGWMAGMLHAHHLPPWVGYGVYIGEVVAPVLLIVGILTRPAALVLAFDLVMAIYLVLDGRAFQLDQQTGAPGGELNFFYIFAALAIFFLGSGRYALSRGKGRWD
jgi:putative oxidoreductase